MVKIILSQYQLEKYAEKFLKDNYQLKLSIPLRINGRLKTTQGRFIHYKMSNRPVAIELSKYLVENNEPSNVLDVLRHELVHYALFTKGMPFADGHPTFERELKRLGVISQETIGSYGIKFKPSNIHNYQCSDCNYVFRRKRQLPHKGAYSRCSCGGGLNYRGKELIKESS